jgi:erythrin-vacuolar iron transport family protein
MAVAVDFRSLSLMDALDLAILVEDEARDRYTELAEQLEGHHTAEAAAFFRTMVENERKHGDELRGRRLEIFGELPAKVTAAMLFDVEAPGYEEVRTFMSGREALLVALSSEEKAHAFFDAALAVVPPGEVADLFAELRDEELEHRDLVRHQLDRLPPETTVATPELEDEPVAQ